MAGHQARAGDRQWADPFPEGPEVTVKADSITLETVLRQVVRANQTLAAGHQRRQSMKELVGQAGRRPNPELEIEAEDVSGDLTGFSQSEISLSVSQEFELWGKGKTRQEAARRDLEYVDLENRIEAFDLYAQTRILFQAVLHAQKKLELSDRAVELATSLTAATEIRVDNGATPPSELLLAELSLEQARLELARAGTKVSTARRSLAALWNADDDSFTAIDQNSKRAPLPALSELEAFLPESRAVVSLQYEEARLRSQAAMERAAGRPGLTLSGGIKRLQGDKEKSFLIGLAIPLPFFDRNQGQVRSLQANARAVRLLTDQALVEAEADLKTHYMELSQLRQTYESVQTILLPKAEETYSSLERAYRMGRIPYSSLVEGEGRLLDLHFELNDLALTIIEETVALEQLLGLTFDDILADEKRNQS